MNDLLRHYYERELTFMRASGVEFAQKYPKIAARLLLETDRCEDPHTERLLEGFSFLAARVKKKIDDHFPEISEALLQVIHPQFMRQLPAMTVIKFMPELKNTPPSGHLFKKGTQLKSPPVEGIQLEFQTTDNVMLLPVEIADVRIAHPFNPGLEADSGIQIELTTPTKMKLNLIEWPDSLRFFLNDYQALKLYELLMNRAVKVDIVSYTTLQDGRRSPEDALTLPGNCLRPTGFAQNEAILPWPEFLHGNRLLFEYFAFAEKFMFFEISGLKQIRHFSGNVLEISIYLDINDAGRLPISKNTFSLYATPAVNLFTMTTMPVQVGRENAEYPINHDVQNKNAIEIFSIDKVTGSTGLGRDDVEYQPFYGLSHFNAQTDDEAYWHLRYRKSLRKGDDGMDASLSFTDADMVAVVPPCVTFTAHTTCTNRDLPSKMAPTRSEKDFFLKGQGPVKGVACLIEPTLPHRLKPDGLMQWRLISHLALNHQLLDFNEGQGLKDLLGLYDVHACPVTRQQIESIERITHKRVAMRLGRSFCLGVEITLVVNEDKFRDSGAYLFASVLERFIAQCVSVKACTRLVIKSLQRRQVIKAWPPRKGQRVLL